jgi:hypothetical protein
MTYDGVPMGALELAVEASKAAKAEYRACDIAEDGGRYYIPEYATALAAFPYFRDWIGQYLMWDFSEAECKILQKQIAYKEVVFRIDGPVRLQIGRASQMMQWDLGYGKFGGGLAFRPHLEITYTPKPEVLEFFPIRCHTLGYGKVEEGRILCGFDEKGKKYIQGLISDRVCCPIRILYLLPVYM